MTPESAAEKDYQRRRQGRFRWTDLGHAAQMIFRHKLTNPIDVVFEEGEEEGGALQPVALFDARRLPSVEVTATIAQDAEALRLTVYYFADVPVIEQEDRPPMYLVVLLRWHDDDQEEAEAHCVSLGGDHLRERADAFITRIMRNVQQRFGAAILGRTDGEDGAPTNPPPGEQGGDLDEAPTQVYDPDAEDA